MKKIYFILIIFLFGLFSINLVNGFGVSSSYSTDRPLTVYPGETKDVELILLPSPDEDNLKIEASFLDDGGIASFIDRNLEYSVTQAEYAYVNIRLKIPEKARIGTEYDVKIRFSDITPSERTGTIDLRLGSVIALNPKVVRVPTEIPKGILWIIILIVLIVGVGVVIWLVIKNDKFKNYILKNKYLNTFIHLNPYGKRVR